MLVVAVVPGAPTIWMFARRRQTQLLFHPLTLLTLDRYGRACGKVRFLCPGPRYPIQIIEPREHIAGL